MNAPTHGELMAFVDGELEDQRAEEVASWLESHEEDAAIVADMMRLGELVEEASNEAMAEQGATGTFDVAGDVMAAIERIDVAAKNAKLASTPPPPRVLSMRPAAPHDREARTKTRRRTYALGAGILAIAAIAAASLVYVKVASEDVATKDASQIEKARLAEEKLASMTAKPEETPDPSDDRALNTPTAVDTVDFGAHQGAIFYVPGGAATSTTVVWIADDEGSKQ